MSFVKFLFFTVFSVSVFSLQGCSSTGVIPLGEDAYLLAKKDGMPGLGVSHSVKADIYNEANVFCKEKGLVVKTLEVHTIPARLAQLGSTELRFKCIKKGSTSESFATEIIEIRK